VRVRKAVNMAINKKAIIDGVYLGTGVAAKNPLPPSMSAYNDAIKDDAYDPEGAKKLLAQAGLRTASTTDLWAMPVQRPYNPNAKRIAELMQADLAKVGFKARSRPSSGASTASACRPASTRWACWAGPATTATRTTSWPCCSAANRPRPTAPTSPSSANRSSRS
jgi:ABC-type transport system substrate-binding protein